jgi:hypothetical protein
MKYQIFAVCMFLCLVPALALGHDSPYSRRAPQPPADYYFASMLDAPILDPTETEAIQEQTIFQRQPRPGILQRAFCSAGTIVADTDNLNIGEFDFSATLGFPMPTRESPLLVTPSFSWDELRNHTLDLPDGLYSAAVELRYLRPIGARWKMDLAVTPGVYGNSDTSENNIRIQGRAIGLYQWRPTTTLALGVVYLDRDDVAVLPAAGVIWTPTDYLKLDLLFPRPRIALRGHGDCHAAWWVYFAGEFGGGSWGVTRANGESDTATLRDIRMLMGLERQADLCTLKIEAGTVLGRELEYASGRGDTSLDDAFIARTVLAY